MVDDLIKAGLKQQTLPEGLTFSPERVVNNVKEEVQRGAEGLKKEVAETHLATRTARAAVRGARKLFGR